MSESRTRVTDLEVIYDEARIASRDIEVIVRENFGWFEYLDENKVARYVYEILLDCFGRVDKDESIGFKSIGVPFVWILWPFAKLIYHCSIANIQKVFSASKKTEIANKVLLLPVLKVKPHLLSILESGIQRKYPCFTMALTSNKLWREVSENVQGNCDPYVESLFSSRDFFAFFRIMVKTVCHTAYIFKRDIIRGIFEKYGINDRKSKTVIFRRLIYGIFDNVEYCLIGKRISALNPSAVISEVTTVGKIAFIMSYLNRVNILTIGVQHGFVTDTHRFYPASRYFCCVSRYALERLQEADEERKKYYFLGSLQEQMTQKKVVESRKIGRNEGGFGIVDSKDEILMLLRQRVDILNGSKYLRWISKIYVKSHPRFLESSNIDNWLELPKLENLGVSNWETFASKIDIAITLSYDAIYELMRRKIVTIVLNPAKRVDIKKFPKLRNLKFVKDSAELDSILSDVLAGKIKWDKFEEQKIDQFLEYVYGSNDENFYIQSVCKIIDKEAAV